MLSPRAFVLLLLCTIRLPPMVGHGLDEATQVRTQQQQQQQQQREELGNTELPGLLEEVKPRPEEMEPSLEERAAILEQSNFSWGALLFAAPLKQWHFQVVAGELVLLVGLRLGLWKRFWLLLRAMAPRIVPALVFLNIIWLTLVLGCGWLAWEDLLFLASKFCALAGYLVLLVRLSMWLRKKIPSPDRSKEQEGSSSNTGQAEDEEREVDDCVERLVREKVRRSAWSVAYRRQAVENLVSDLLHVFQEHLSTTFFPVLQPPIGVGGAFEGWSPRGHGAVYSLLVPLKPPHGHAFHLELGTAEEDTPAKHRVRVELECTCTKDMRGENMLCFVHQPSEALERNQESSLLSKLCTGRYLDAQKIARWLQDSVSSAWEKVPHSRRYTLRVLPSGRSCKLELTSASGRSLYVEMLFGVQRDDTDLFLSSQAPEAIFTPGTVWAESSAVAEAKFFSHVARQAPAWSCKSGLRA